MDRGGAGSGGRKLRAPRAMTEANDVGVSSEESLVWTGTGPGIGDVGLESSKLLLEVMAATAKQRLIWRERGGERG